MPEVSSRSWRHAPTACSCPPRRRCSHPFRDAAPPVCCTRIWKAKQFSVRKSPQSVNAAVVEFLQPRRCLFDKPFAIPSLANNKLFAIPSLASMQVLHFRRQPCTKQTVIQRTALLRFNGAEHRPRSYSSSLQHTESGRHLF